MNNYIGELTGYLLSCEQHFAEKRSELEKLIHQAEESYSNEEEAQLLKNQIISFRQKVLRWIGEQFNYTGKLENEDLDNNEKTLLISIISYLDRASAEFANMSDEGEEIIRKIVEQAKKKS